MIGFTNSEKRTFSETLGKERYASHVEPFAPLFDFGMLFHE